MAPNAHHHPIVPSTSCGASQESLKLIQTSVQQNLDARRRADDDDRDGDTDATGSGGGRAGQSVGEGGGGRVYEEDAQVLQKTNTLGWCMDFGLWESCANSQEWCSAPCREVILRSYVNVSDEALAVSRGWISVGA